MVLLYWRQGLTKPLKIKVALMMFNEKESCQCRIAYMASAVYTHLKQHGLKINEIEVDLTKHVLRHARADTT